MPRRRSYALSAKSCRVPPSLVDDPVNTVVQELVQELGLVLLLQRVVQHKTRRTVMQKLDPAQKMVRDVCDVKVRVLFSRADCCCWLCLVPANAILLVAPCTCRVHQ